MDSNDLDITSPVYTVGVASRLSGIPAHSIRQYINNGLIIPLFPLKKNPTGICFPLLILHV